MGQTKQVTVTLSKTTFETLESRVDTTSGESRSQRIDGDLNFLWGILGYGLNEAKKKLTKRQAKLILDALNGTWLLIGTGSSIGLWASGGLAHEVSDAIALNGADKKWKVDGKQTVKAVSSLSSASVFALLDFARMFWADTNQDIDAFVEGFQK